VLQCQVWLEAGLTVSDEDESDAGAIVVTQRALCRSAACTWGPSYNLAATVPTPCLHTRQGVRVCALSSLDLPISSNQCVSIK
jgi:hypothetical protein